MGNVTHRLLTVDMLTLPQSVCCISARSFNVALWEKLRSFAKAEMTRFPLDKNLDVSGWDWDGRRYLRLIRIQTPRLFRCVSGTGMG